MESLNRHQIRNRDGDTPKIVIPVGVIVLGKVIELGYLLVNPSTHRAAETRHAGGHDGFTVGVGREHDGFSEGIILRLNALVCHPFFLFREGAV